MSAGPLKGYTGFQSRSSEYYELQPGVPEVSRTSKFSTLRQEAHETDKLTKGPQAGSFVYPKAEQASETMRQTMNVSATDYRPPQKSYVFYASFIPFETNELVDTNYWNFLNDDYLQRGKEKASYG